VLTIFLLVLTGCTSIKQLKPAIDANQRNIRDLQANHASTMKLVRHLTEAVWDSELAARRTRIGKRLVDLRLEVGMDGEGATRGIAQALADSTSPAHQDFENLKAGLTAFADPSPSRYRYIQRYPILYAYFAKAVTADQINTHLNLASRVRSLSPAERNAITDVYPYVAQILDLRRSTGARLERIQQRTADQFRLALAHAALFQYAADTNLNVEQAFKQVLADEGLQGEILGRIKNQGVSHAINSLIGDLELRSPASHETSAP